MHQKGHLGFALLTWAPIVAVVGHSFEALVPYVLVGTMVLVNPLMPLAFLINRQSAALDGQFSLSLCMIPDVDVKIPWVKHRGITHTVWFAVLFAGLTAGVGYGLLELVASAGVEASPETMRIGVAFAGYLGFHAVASHVLADAITPMGIRPFAPLWNRSFGLGIVTAGNAIANDALLVAGGGAVVVAFLVPYWQPP